MTTALVNSQEEFEKTLSKIKGFKVKIDLFDFEKIYFWLDILSTVSHYSEKTKQKNFFETKTIRIAAVNIASSIYGYSMSSDFINAAEEYAVNITDYLYELAEKNNIKSGSNFKFDDTFIKMIKVFDFNNLPNIKFDGEKFKDYKGFKGVNI